MYKELVITRIAPKREGATSRFDDFTHQPNPSDRIDPMNASVPKVSGLQALFLVQLFECNTIAAVIKAISKNPFENVDKRAIYQVAKTLEKNGLIQKVPNTNRETAVRLTARGKATIEDALGFYRDITPAGIA